MTRILPVDDDPQVRGFCERALSRADFDVLAAESGGALREPNWKRMKLAYARPVSIAVETRRGNDVEADMLRPELSFLGDPGLGDSQRRVDHGGGIDLLAEHMTREVGGLGVGLAVARRIPEAHGGGISVESRPSEGSNLTVLLPATQAGAESGGQA